MHLVVLPGSAYGEVEAAATSMFSCSNVGMLADLFRMPASAASCTSSLLLLRESEPEPTSGNKYHKAVSERKWVVLCLRAVIGAQNQNSCPLHRGLFRVRQLSQNAEPWNRYRW